MNDILSEATSPSKPIEATSPSAPIVEEQKEETFLGRPCKYTPEMHKKALDYLASCVDYIREPDEDADEELEEQAHGGSLRRRYRATTFVKIPTRGGLAVALSVARSTLYKWADEFPDFSDIMETLGSIQEERLINHGLGGSYNPTITKVLLTKHGYREGTELTGGDGAPLIPVDSSQKAKTDKAIGAFLKHGRTPSDSKTG